MTLQTYAEYLKKFFSAERKTLAQNYPGITLHRLSTEVPIPNQDDLYLPARNHPFGYFIAKLKSGIPLEYISGRAYFFRSYFLVNEKVLIPRNETEILVELTIQEIQRNFKNKPCKVLDVCTGSGIIGLSLLREGGAVFDMTLSDLSPEALEIAKKNYFLMQYLFTPQHKIQFVESDRLQNISGDFDIILSNPPYIKKTSDQASVHEQVKKHEPEMALFLNDADYETWFRVFFSELADHLVKGGFALIEGHENHLEGLKELAVKIGFIETDIIQDYSQRNRFLRLMK